MKAQPVDRLGRPLIYDMTQKVPPMRKFSDFTIGSVAFILWVYLMHPLVLTLLWASGIYEGYRHFFTLHGIDNPVFFEYAACAVAGIFIAMLAWSRYNFLRFHGAERRKSRGEADVASMAEYYRICPADIERARSAGNIEVSFPGKGMIDIRAGQDPAFSAEYDPQRHEAEFKKHGHQYASGVKQDSDNGKNDGKTE